MYVMLKRDRDNKLMGLCFVQAESSERAKKVAGIKDDSTEWTPVPTDVINELESAKEGYVLKTF